MIIIRRSKPKEVREMKFTKMHGCGNDFVIIDQRNSVHTLSIEKIKYICDRHMGVGCDQLIVLEPSKNADLFMRIYNPDATESEACGNATRCVADLTNVESIETLGGTLKVQRQGDLIAVDMGIPKLLEKSFPEIIDGLSDPVLLDVGNPHAVYFVDDFNAINIPKIGKTIENHSFFPNRTNGEFVKILSKDKVRLRTWERGAGLTLACGSAACATVFAGFKKGVTTPKLEVEVDGGTLYMEYRENDGHVIMTGPTAHVFDGELKTL